MKLFRAFATAAIFVQSIAVLGAIGYAKNLKLYDGPERPASELVTIVVDGDSFLINLSIQVNGKWVRAHSGAQVLPGTYNVSVLSMCGHPAQYPPANPPLNYYSFFEYPDSFLAAPGDTVTFAILGEHVPIVNESGRKGQKFPAPPGTTCYGASAAYHTITKGSALEPDDVHNNGGISTPAAIAVLKYLEAIGRADQVAAGAYLATDFKGDIATAFSQMRKSGFRFSASNTKILGEQADPISGVSRVVADVTFTSGPLSFKVYQEVFTVRSDESGALKISRIVDWWGPGA